MDNISCIGWIVPSFTDFSTAEEFLQDPQPQPIWDNFMYSVGRIGQNRVVLACATSNANVYETVRKMLEYLELKGMELKACFVSTFGYASTFHCEPAIGDCVIRPYEVADGFFQIARKNVTGTHLNNASILLQATNMVVNNQQGYSTGDNTMGYIRREYNPEEADIAWRICCSQGFEYAPCISVTGICGYNAGDENVQWVSFATEKAADTIVSIIERIGGLY